MRVGPSLISASIACTAFACSPQPLHAPSPLSERTGTIDTLAIRAHTYFLADDRLRGRDTGSPGADLAALYIGAACRALGLSPLGDSFDQTVPMALARTDGSQLELRTPSAQMIFRDPDDFVVNGATATTLSNFQGPAVFVGSAENIVSGRLPPLAGAVAVTIGSIGPGPALDSLKARGAIGMVHLTGDAGAFHQYVQARGADIAHLSDTTVFSSYFPSLPSIAAGPAASRALLERGAPLAIGPLGGTITVRVQGARHGIAARNVVCVLRGSDPLRRDSALAFTAHFDHLGVASPDERGDSIYNGFSDNAAGVAMLLAIAQALQRDAEPPRHSVLFLFFTGEERGLLGSDYYVSHPLWPLNTTIGVINLDAGAPPARVWSWRIAGGEGSALSHLAVDVALARGWSAVTSGPRANSDYFPFVRVGVPAIFIVPGPAPYQGLSADSSQALRRRWDHYHQPADEWRDDFPFVGLQRYAEFALATGRALDRGGLSPNATGVRPR
jgi:hypothetical protein